MLQEFNIFVKVYSDSRQDKSRFFQPLDLCITGNFKWNGNKAECQCLSNRATTTPQLLINYTYSVHDSLFVRSASTNSRSYLAFSGFNFFNGPTFFSLERLLTVPRTIYSPASNNWRTMWLARKPLAPVTKTRAMDVVSWAKFECVIYCRTFCAVYKGVSHLVRILCWKVHYTSRIGQY